MSKRLHHAVREAAGLAAASKRTLQAGVTLTPAAAPSVLSLAAGARVLDLVTGQEGVILGGRIEHILVPSSDTAAA